MADHPVDVSEYVLDHLTQALHGQAAIVMVDGQFQIAPEVDDDVLLSTLGRLAVAQLEIIAQLATEIDLLRGQSSPPIR